VGRGALRRVDHWTWSTARFGAWPTARFGAWSTARFGAWSTGYDTTFFEITKVNWPAQYVIP
jgi:hypothetical protein